MKKTWLLIFRFIFIAIIGYGGWFLITRLLAADPTISASIVGAMTTIFISLAVVVINNKHTKLRDIAEAHRTKKVEIYKEYIKTITALLLGGNADVSLQAPTEQELIDYLVDHKKNILLWGSPEVIKCQLKLESLEGRKDAATVILAVDNLYKAIRNDIGLSNSGLNNHELVKIFITDRDELDKLMEP